MGIGTSLFLIAVGAILKFAVADAIEGVELSTIGLILMVVGILGLLISLFYANLFNRGRTTGAVVERERVRDREVL
jgi:Co/Zn/Cd efflux system component